METEGSDILPGFCVGGRLLSRSLRWSLYTPSEGLWRSGVPPVPLRATMKRFANRHRGPEASRALGENLFILFPTRRLTDFLASANAVKPPLYSGIDQYYKCRKGDRLAQPLFKHAFSEFGGGAVSFVPCCGAVCGGPPSHTALHTVAFFLSGYPGVGQ